MGKWMRPAREKILRFLTPPRLRDYPRLILAAFSVVAVLNLLLRQGWEGGIYGIIGFDFLAFYSSGLLYWKDASSLYDFDTLARLQQALIAPTSLGGGVNIFSYPPYVALTFSLFNFLPLGWGYALWTGLSLLAVGISARWMAYHIVPETLRQNGLTWGQLTVLILAFFPTLFGLQNGQNQSITLLLLTGMVIFSIQRRWSLAGLLAGLLIYKPQFVLGFLILWLAWRQYRPLVSFAAIAAAWAGLAFLISGPKPYLRYLETIPQLLTMPFGVARGLEVSLPALAATILGPQRLNWITLLTQALLLAGTLALGWIGWRLQKRPQHDETPAYIAAVLYPFLVSPHALIYDLILVALILVLWTRFGPCEDLLLGAILLYLVVYVLLPLAQYTQVALLSLIPIGLALALGHHLVRPQESA